MNKFIFLVPAAALVLGCALEASDAESPSSLAVMSWNVQALFDGKDAGHEYAEYRPGSGWNAEKYRARLLAAGEAVKTVAPDVLALVEVENEEVLAALAEEAGFAAGWSFFAKTPGTALGVGLLSRYPITCAKTHSAFFGEAETPRPIAEVWIDAGGEEIAFFVCHWKSKLGGDEATEKLRRAEAAIVSRRLAEIGAAVPAVVLGDLNENWDEFARTGGAYLCALMREGDDSSEVKGEASGRPGFRDYLVLTGGVPGPGELYSPWAEQESGGGWAGGGSGSYFYNFQWETIDHILLSAAAFDGRGWEYGGFEVAAEPPFADASGYPHSYIPWTGDGLSDHLPVTARLEKRAAE